MEFQENSTVLVNLVVKQQLHDIAKKYLNSNNYIISIERGSSKGDNYIGVVYRAILKVNNNDQANNNTNLNQNEMSIIIKVPPENEIRRKQFFARPTFLRESLVYNEIIPMFLEFQRRKEIVLEKHGFHEVPRCYAALTTEGHEAIFLEDLKQHGFQMFNRLKTITADHVKLVMKKLGKLHAVSLVMKDQVPNEITKYSDMKDIFFERKDDERLSNYFENLKIRALNTLSSNTDQHLIERVTKFFENKDFMTVMLNIIDGKKAEPYAVLCHGDCWNNNVLYKYEGKRPIEAYLIDWQITRYASPACDLTYFIFSCTTKELRDKYYDTFIDEYYQAAVELIQRLGSDACSIYPREALDQQLKQNGSFGLLMAMVLLPIFTSHADDIPDLDELSEKLECGNIDANQDFNSLRTISVYTKRMKDVIVDIVKLGYV